MRRQTGMALLLSAAAVSVMVAASSAQEPAKEPLPQEIGHSQPSGEQSRGELPRHAPFGGPDRPFGFGPRKPGIEIAGQLAAAETYIGVKSDQLDAWRGYTSALLDFLPPVGKAPEGKPDEAGRPPRAPGDDAAATRLPAERLAEEAIARGEKAKQLKAAIDQLKGALQPEQLKKFAEIGLPFPPFPGRPGERPPFGDDHGKTPDGPQQGDDARGDAPGDEGFPPPPHGDR